MNFKKVGAIAPIYTGGTFLKRDGALFTTRNGAVLRDGVVVFDAGAPLLFDWLDEIVVAVANRVSHKKAEICFDAVVTHLSAGNGLVVAATATECALLDSALRVVARKKFAATASAIFGGSAVFGTEKGDLHFFAGGVKKHGSARVTGIAHAQHLVSASIDGRVVFWADPPVVFDLGAIVALGVFRGDVVAVAPDALFCAKNGEFAALETGVAKNAAPFVAQFCFKAMRDGVVATTENELIDLATGHFVIGNNDEVTDLKIDNGLVVCTNSGRLRVYAAVPKLVQAHADAILSYADGVSCSRESVVFYDGDFTPTAAIAISASCVERAGPATYVGVHGSVHCIGAAQKNCAHGDRACFSWKAHEKDVTAIAATKAHVATASLDKSVKLWTVGDFRLVATVRHKRGVNCLIATDTELISADECVKTWKLPEMEILSTIEHNVAIVSLRKTAGLLFAGDALGVLRVYKDAKLRFQTDAHADRIWTIAHGKLGDLRATLGDSGSDSADVWATGGADGAINFFVDNTAEHARLALVAAMEAKRAENAISLMTKAGDTRSLALALIEKEDARAEVFAKRAFYEDGGKTFAVGLSDAQATWLAKRLAPKGVKSLELCQFLISQRVPRESFRAATRRHKSAVDALFVEMLSLRLFFRGFA